MPALPQYAFMAWCLVKHRDNFTFTLIISTLYSFGVKTTQCRGPDKLKFVNWHRPMGSSAIAFGRKVVVSQFLYLFYQNNEQRPSKIPPCCYSRQARTIKLEVRGVLVRGWH